MELNHYNKDDNIYQNNIAILSLSRFDEDSGRTTAHFNRPSHVINSQHTSTNINTTNTGNTNTEEKRWYRFGLYNFVAASLSIIFLCVILGVVITTYKNVISHSKGELSSLQIHSGSSGTGKEPITLHDILLSSMAPLLFNGTWINNHQIVYYDKLNNLCALDVMRNEIEVIISNQIIASKGLSKDLLSKDKRYLLSPYDTKPSFRHSTLSKYKIYDIINDTLTELLPYDEDFGHGLMQYAQWGHRGSDILFVFKNNIYYKPDIDIEIIKLTESGRTNLIFNGYCDWVYEEEILEDEKAIWLSPDGRNMVYAQINDTLVDTMTWPFYSLFNNFTGQQYPAQVAIKYPKPGRPNPTVKLFVINLNETAENIVIREITPPKMISKHEYYLNAVAWIDDNRFAITWLTRAQNFSVIEVCEQNSMDSKEEWICKTTFTMSSSNSWVELGKAPIGVPANNSYLLKLPQQITEETGYFYHVGLVHIPTKAVKYLTMGKFDIIEIIAFNQQNEQIYFLSSLTEKPEFRHLMSVSLSDEKKSDPICLTCNLGDSCLYNNVFFSPDANYYVLQCEGPKTPRVEIRNTENNSLILDLENNEILEKKISTKAIPKLQKLRVKTSDHFYANVELVLPPDFDINRKYPLMVEVYGGPGGQMVIDKYRLNHWGSHLASNLSVIYARIDGRGSDNRGSKNLHEIYKNLGNAEVMDVITATRFLRDNLTYVDSKNIGIWGWSYGGYVTLMALALDFLDPVFQCGIAVSPVTNWMLYDSVYAERYMGWPYDNMYAYNRSDVLNKVLFLKEKRLLLVFGTADDNVHSQHSMLLMSKLNEVGMFYETQVYPDSGHSLTGVQIHLYEKMEDFVDRCFFY